MINFRASNGPALRLKYRCNLGNGTIEVSTTPQYIPYAVQWALKYKLLSVGIPPQYIYIYILYKL